ncbi:hypothetical protein N9W69_03365 [Flavobacteriaceae bacterium]|nr:hypothetical protein [Flavobacteriaceae bacterium]
MNKQGILFIMCLTFFNFSFSQSSTFHQEYHEGRLIKTISQDGITVSTSLKSTKNQFGNYFLFDISVSNGSNNTVTFKVNDCRATRVVINDRLLKKGKLDKAYKREDMSIMSNKEFQSIIKKKQKWNSFIQSTTSWMRAENAGRVSSTSTLTNDFGRGQANSTWNRESQTNVGVITYLAQENEEKKLQEFREEQYNLRAKWNEEYIKSNTLSPLEGCSGILACEYKSGRYRDYIELTINVEGNKFDFEWSSEESEF